MLNISLLNQPSNKVNFTSPALIVSGAQLFGNHRKSFYFKETSFCLHAVSRNQ